MTMQSKEMKKVAMNIVNQLFDIAEVPVEVRQRVNDVSDEFVTKLLESELTLRTKEILEMIPEEQYIVDGDYQDLKDIKAQIINRYLKEGGE